MAIELTATRIKVLTPPPRRGPCKRTRSGAHYDANYYGYIARNFNAKALRLLVFRHATHKREPQGGNRQSAANTAH